MRTPILLLNTIQVLRNFALAGPHRPHFRRMLRSQVLNVGRLLCHSVACSYACARDKATRRGTRSTVASKDEERSPADGAGAKILNEANHVLIVVDHLTRVAARAGEGGIGHLAVGIPGGLNEIPIAVLRIFTKRYPAVRIELKYMNTDRRLKAYAKVSFKLPF